MDLGHSMGDAEGDSEDPGECLRTSGLCLGTTTTEGQFVGSVPNLSTSGSHVAPFLCSRETKPPIGFSVERWTGYSRQLK